MRLTSLSIIRRPNGFSLIELMVGMVIALLATLIIMQVYELFEGQKRTTSGGADAQTNGSIALYNIQRDVAVAGYGTPVFSTRNTALMCDPLPTFDVDANAATPEAGIYPVLLADGGVGPGASDTVTATYGDTARGGIPIAATVAGNFAVVANNLGCQIGDIALMVNGVTCELQKVSNLVGTTGIEFQNNPTVTTGMVTCLGGWNEISYSVANGMLSRSGANSVAGIVNIQAQYGISAIPKDNTIVQWVNPTGNWELTKAGNTLTKPVLADRIRIKSIRVAVVAQSGLWEKDVVLTACSSTTLPNPTGVCAWEGTPTSPAPTIDLSNLPDWDHYRYRVFEVIIPVRNVIWSLNTLG